MEFQMAPTIEEIIQKYDVAGRLSDFHVISGEISAARNALTEELQRDAAYLDLAAFIFSVGFDDGSSPWHTYFRPIASWTAKDGTTTHNPDPNNLPAGAIDHWIARAERAVNQAIKARYADLAWEFAPIVEKGRKRDIKLARMAVDAYIGAVRDELDGKSWDAIVSAKRAVDLAATLGDRERLADARGVLLELHRKNTADGSYDWWPHAYDHLTSNKKLELTDAEKDELVGDLEAVFKLRSSPESLSFDPHDTESAGRRLVSHYERSKKQADVKRVHIAIARAFEHVAKQANAQLASTFLNTSLAHYVKAGEGEEAERVRIVMEEKIRLSRAEMGTITHRTEVPKAVVDQFINSLVVDSPHQTLSNIAVQFLPRVGPLQKQVQDQKVHAPLYAMISQEIVVDNLVVARIGGVDDDPEGRLVHEATNALQLEVVWLSWAISAAMKKFGFTGEQLSFWADQEGLFGEQRRGMLKRGLDAWLQEDYITALHVLLPQIEHALRNFSARIGKPTTKAYQAVPGTSVAINMGDVVFVNGAMNALGDMGPSLKLYLQMLYVDPRGLNLRNRFAHGLLGADEITPDVVLWIAHTALLLGILMKMARVEPQAIA